MLPLLAAAAATTAVVAAAPVTDPQAEVRAAMAASAAGWNAGDLDRFMAIYARDALYVTAKGMVYGKEAIAARYRDSFAAGGNTRGRLSFQPLAFRTISNVHQLLVAKWTLTPAAAGAAPASGYTTLLFERQPAGWRIISDHSD